MLNQKELNQRKDKRLKELAKQEGDPGWDAKAFLRGPKAELLARVNAWVRWIDPGEPVNWRGL
jgi:hypothetical protein